METVLPEDLKTCPYVLNHRMPASRLQYHLASCKKKNPKIAKKMANCKYNACHVVPIEWLKEHEANCTERTAVMMSHLIFQRLVLQIPDTDMWNEDNMHHSPSFILQTFTPKLQVCESEPRELKKEAMDNNDPNNYKFWRKTNRKFNFKWFFF
uniref:CHHC U11-48K-type domain-containing protein n=1 Tax=Marmota marmota marmota TaxID=9994 RepID=A0A8C6EVK4_MARMA